MKHHDQFRYQECSCEEKGFERSVILYSYYSFIISIYFRSEYNKFVIKYIILGNNCYHLYTIYCVFIK